MVQIDERSENVRIINLTTNNRVILTREDPYGFWRITFEKGQVPQWMKDMVFTSVDECIKKLEPYLNVKGKEVVKA